MRTTIFRAAALAFVLGGLQGCAAIALPLLATGIGIGAGTGIEYTMNGIAYRTFSANIDEVHRATLTTLRRMAMTLKTDDTAAEGRSVVAQASDRTVEIDLERLTAKTTRMRVVVKQGFFWRDRATAGEIIAQAGQTLEDQPAVFRKRG